MLRAGLQVTARWQPATDDISRGEITLRRPGSNVESSIVVRNDKLSIQGDRIDFTVPALPATLHGEIAVQLIGTAGIKPHTGPCPVDRCSVEVSFDAAPAAARVP